MSTTRLHDGRKALIVYYCDELGCDEELITDYSTWDYAKAQMKREGWYIMRAGYDGWDHLCPCHGKARWIAQKRAEEAPHA